MTLRIKICGLKTEAAIAAAVDAGADEIGFVLVPSPRQITLEVATRLREAVP